MFLGRFRGSEHLVGLLIVIKVFLDRCSKTVENMHLAGLLLVITVFLDRFRVSEHIRFTYSYYCVSGKV